MAALRATIHCLIGSFTELAAINCSVFVLPAIKSLRSQPQSPEIVATQSSFTGTLHGDN